MAIWVTTTASNTLAIGNHLAVFWEGRTSLVSSISCGSGSGNMNGPEGTVMMRAEPVVTGFGRSSLTIVN